MSWIFILVLYIHIVSLTVFVFEWISPSGYDMKNYPPRGSLSTYEHFSCMDLFFFLLATFYWLLSIGYSLLATFYWLLSIGYFLLAECSHSYVMRHRTLRLKNCKTNPIFVSHLMLCDLYLVDKEQYGCYKILHDAFSYAQLHCK